MAKSNEETPATAPVAEKVEKPAIGPVVTYRSTSAPMQEHQMPKKDWDRLRGENLLQHCELISASE